MNYNKYPKALIDIPKKGNVVHIFDKAYICTDIIRYKIEINIHDYDVYILRVILNNTKYGAAIYIKKGLFTEKQVLEHFNNV